VAGAGLVFAAVLGAAVLLGAVVLAESTIGLGHLLRGHTAAVLVGGCLLLLALVLIGGFVAGLSQREPE
jgi:hypothetical protein